MSTKGKIPLDVFCKKKKNTKKIQTETGIILVALIIFSDLLYL
jgi:hypothetical protein